MRHTRGNGASDPTVHVLCSRGRAVPERGARGLHQVVLRGTSVSTHSATAGTHRAGRGARPTERGTRWLAASVRRSGHEATLPIVCCLLPVKATPLDICRLVSAGPPANRL